MRACMLNATVSILIAAPPAAVAALFRDWKRWPKIFGRTIRHVELLEENQREVRLAIDHKVGRVINVMTDVAPDRVDLWEEKPRYVATFENHFDAADDGTHYSVVAHVRLKGMIRILAPFLGRYVRSQIRQYITEPVKRAAERY